MNYKCFKTGVTNLQRAAGRTADYRDPRGPHGDIGVALVAAKPLRGSGEAATYERFAARWGERERGLQCMVIAD